ncbi:hypothetical protein FRC12_003162 [Ceratobasidium sp. 428]|nr:hypothetical protein FRC12_003162 [Ceratobasidium sp. 428]
MENTSAAEVRSVTVLPRPGVREEEISHILSLLAHRVKSPVLAVPPSILISSPPLSSTRFGFTSSPQRPVPEPNPATPTPLPPFGGTISISSRDPPVASSSKHLFAISSSDTVGAKDTNVS